MCADRAIAPNGTTERLTGPPHYDPAALGSDVPRSARQYLARKAAAFLVTAFRLNRSGFWSTEFVQQIYPTYTIPTKVGGLRCKCGHGRLRWRAETFYSEEPETVAWLDSIGPDGFLWDVGANVGLYSLYAAKVAKARVLAIEPEAQNFAILLENIVLNDLQHAIEATNLAISDRFGLGRLFVHAMTKGGAYNTFAARTADRDGPEAGAGVVTQVQVGTSLDDLVMTFGFDAPTHIKIDVDGNEPAIIRGATRVLSNERCRNVLVEIQRNAPDHVAAVAQLEALGYTRVSERSNWESRASRELRARAEAEHPAVNMIFTRA